MSNSSAGQRITARSGASRLYDIIKSMPPFLKNKRILIALAILVIVIGAAVCFIFLLQNTSQKKAAEKVALESASQVVFTQNLGDGTTLENILSVEKAEADKYQPIVTMKLTKPKGQEFRPSLIIIQRIPKQFSQSADELSFSIPPWKILEKDPIVVWKFDQDSGLYCFWDVTYELPSNSTQSRNSFSNSLAMIVWQTEEDKQQPPEPEEETKLGDGCYDLKALDIEYRDSFNEEVLTPQYAELEKLSREERAQKLNELITQYIDEQKQKSAEEQRQKAEVIKKKREEYNQQIAEWANQISDWVAGRIEELIITVKQKVMGEDEAMKVFTETVTQATGKAPLIETTPALNIEKKAAQKTSTNPGRIAFVRDSNIWIMDPDGGNQKQLTFDGIKTASYAHPTWAPDAKRIAFGKEDGEAEIWIMDAENGAKRKLNINYGSNTKKTSDVGPFAWSPEGNVIAYPVYVYDYNNNSNRNLYLVWPDKPEPLAPERINITIKHISSLQGTPDGKYLLYSGDCKKQVGGGDEVCLTNFMGQVRNISQSAANEDGGVALCPPVPYLDGKPCDLIAFGADRYDSFFDNIGDDIANCNRELPPEKRSWLCINEDDIFLAHFTDVDSEFENSVPSAVHMTGLEKLSFNPIAGGLYSPTWSPDATKIAFAREAIRWEAGEDVNEIYVLDVKTAVAHKITDNAEQPNWSWPGVFK